MLQLGDLLEVRWDCVHFATREEVRALHGPLAEKGLLVLEVPGHKARSERRLLRLLKRELQLPDYFAENWVSLQFCLMRWHETRPASKGYVLFFQDADELWAHRKTMAWKLLRAWREAAPTWRERGTPFHLVFVSETGDALFDEEEDEPEPTTDLVE